MSKRLSMRGATLGTCTLEEKPAVVLRDKHRAVVGKWEGQADYRAGVCDGGDR